MSLNDASVSRREAVLMAPVPVPENVIRGGLQPLFAHVPPSSIPCEGKDEERRVLRTLNILAPPQDFSAFPVFSACAGERRSHHYTSPIHAISQTPASSSVQTGSSR